MNDPVSHILTQMGHIVSSHQSNISISGPDHQEISSRATFIFALHTLQISRVSLQILHPEEGREMATGNSGYSSSNRPAEDRSPIRWADLAKLTFWRIPLLSCRTFPAPDWLVVGKPTNGRRRWSWHFSPTWKFAQMNKTWSVWSSLQAQPSLAPSLAEACQAHLLILGTQSDKTSLTSTSLDCLWWVSKLEMCCLVPCLCSCPRMFDWWEKGWETLDKKLLAAGAL